MCTSMNGGSKLRARSWTAARTRLYGEALRDFIERWDLLTRGSDMVVPEHLYTAPLPVVAAYLRSIFQAEGCVSARAASTVVEVNMISEQIIRGIQRLLFALRYLLPDRLQGRHPSGS